MKDYLHEILTASARKTKIEFGSIMPDFSLISYRTLSTDAEPLIAGFQQWVKETHGVRVLAVAGGYGCTRIEFEVVSDSPEKAAQFTQAIIQNGDLHEKAREIGFRILILAHPYTRIDLVNSRIEGNTFLQNLIREGGINMTDQSTHIHGSIRNSAVSVHSPHTTQTVTVNPQLDSLYAAILEKARTDDEVTKKQYLQVVDDIDVLKKELSQATPRKSVVERILTNLGSIASLTSLAN
jgi:hypothetical protein